MWLLKRCFYINWCMNSVHKAYCKWSNCLLRWETSINSAFYVSKDSQTHIMNHEIKHLILEANCQPHTTSWFLQWLSEWKPLQTESNPCRTCFFGSLSVKSAAQQCPWHWIMSLKIRFFGFPPIVDSHKHTLQRRVIVKNHTTIIKPEISEPNNSKEITDIIFTLSSTVVIDSESHSISMHPYQFLGPNSTD